MNKILHEELHFRICICVFKLINLLHVLVVVTVIIIITIEIVIAAQQKCRDPRETCGI